MKQIWEWMGTAAGLLIYIPLILGCIVLQWVLPAPKKRGLYDVRANDLGTQYIYQNDSIYITHSVLDSVIVDTVDRSEHQDENY